MSEPVDLAKARKDAERARDAGRLIWVCNCKCVSFRAYADGSMQCASCDVFVTGYEGDWRRRLPDVPDKPKDVDVDAVRVVAIDTAEVFAKRAVARSVPIRAILAIYEDGAHTSWQEGAMTSKQLAWLKRQIAKAVKRFTATGDDDG